MIITLMNKFIPLFCIVLLFISCAKKTGASDEAMSVVNERFSLCHLKDSLGESTMTYLWSEYDSENNSVLCFRYGSCAIEYYYHQYNGYRRDTFLVKNGEPIVDQLRDAYNKVTDSEYLSNRLNQKQNELLNGFGDYMKVQFPTEDDFIEHHINCLASNDF